ncbi:MAG: endonuclease III, partial [Candidatus Woesearchaeota archaeon]|nr:endonuclease III [Candidatus Woesearchaeota archaeon]
MKKEDIKDKDIEKIIGILKKETKKFTNTIVNDVSDRPFDVLISCLLSLRTKDATTAGAYKRLFSLAKTPEGMLKLDVKKIEKAIYPVGFYRTKAKRIKEISKTLLEEYHGKVPDEMEELLKLKGVGRKTANIVL